MCGIFGVAAVCRTARERDLVPRVLKSVALLSQSRGRDSSGFAVRAGASATTHVLRAPLPISRLMRRAEFGALLRESIGAEAGAPTRAAPSLIVAIGHSRLVTNGSQLADHNNQPVVRSAVVGVHNGIVVNEDELWKQIPDEQRRFDIDTEVLLALFAHRLALTGSADEALRRVGESVRGSFSVALLPGDRSELILATNTGSLYLTTDGANILVFASERHILRALQHRRIDARLSGLPIDHVQPRTGRVVGLADLSATCRLPT